MKHLEKEKPSFSDDKLQEYKAAFDLYDENNNGYISIGELKTVFDSIGYKPSNEELKEMLMDHEEDIKKETINFEEFADLLSHKVRDEDLGKEIIEAFKLLDEGGQGLISVKELKETLLQNGETLSDEEIDKIIGDADEDCDGFINYEDFVKKLFHS